jgi:hypothetical protein
LIKHPKLNLGYTSRRASIFISAEDIKHTLRIEKEAEDTCLYKRILLDYTYGIGKIYTAQEIEKAKQSPSFEREYNLKYLGKIGNVFHTKDIEAAIARGRKYNPDNFIPYYSSTSRSMGIDPAYGSSAFGIVVTQWEDNHIQILVC